MINRLPPPFTLCAAALLMLWASAAGADYAAGERAYAEKDYALAYKEWKASALDGDSPSMQALALMLANGTGVTRDVVTAYAWLTLAARGGVAEAGAQASVLADKYVPRYCEYDALGMVRAYLAGNKDRIAAGNRQNSRCWRFGTPDLRKRR